MQITLTKEQVREAFGELRYMGADYCYKYDNPSETLLLICVTGDVAYSGNTEEYAMAELFFEDIYDKIISRHNGLYVHFMFVPGNHDYVA